MAKLRVHLFTKSASFLLALRDEKTELYKFVYANSHSLCRASTGELLTDFIILLVLL